MSIRSKILECKTLVKEINDPCFGTLFVRRLTIAESQEIKRIHTESADGTPDEKQEAAVAICCRLLCEEDGSPVFDPSDAEQREQFKRHVPGETIGNIIDQAMGINRVGVESGKASS